MKTPRTLRTALAALVLTGGLGMTAACTVEDDDPDTVIREDDGGNEAPDVNIENDNEDAPDVEESPAG